MRDGRNINPTGPGHTPARHGETGHTEDVDLRGSSVPTNVDDISMDISETEPAEAETRGD